jgi:hypothetical protein
MRNIAPSDVSSFVQEVITEAMELLSEIILTNATPLKPALTFLRRTAKTTSKTAIPATSKSKTKVSHLWMVSKR